MAGLAAGASPPVDVAKTFSDVDAFGRPSFQKQLYQYYDKKATEKVAASPSPGSFGPRGAIIVAVNQSEEEQHYTGRFGTRFEASTRLKKITTQCFRDDNVDTEETMVTRHDEATDSVLLMRLQAFLQTTKPTICGLEEAYQPYKMKPDEIRAYKCEAEAVDPGLPKRQIRPNLKRYATKLGGWQRPARASTMIRRNNRFLIICTGNRLSKWRPRLNDAFIITRRCKSGLQPTRQCTNQNLA